MGQSNSQFVYRRTPSVVCRSWKNGSAILSLPIREPKIEKVAKYGIGKQWVELVFTNILKFVMDIPLPGKIFSAFFWTSCVGIFSVTISSSLYLINNNIYDCCMMRC
jgi:hypothetical protein